MKHCPLTWAATLMLGLAPLTSAFGGADASLRITAKNVSSGILRIIRFGIADECQDGDQIARLTKKLPSKKTRFVGGGEVAIMINYFSMSIDIQSVAGGLSNRSSVREGATILKFDSVVGAQYELVIQKEGSRLNYRLHKLETTAAATHPVAIRAYAVAPDVEVNEAPEIVKWCPGNTIVPASATRLPTKQEAYQTCIDRGVSQESCAWNYLSD